METMKTTAEKPLNVRLPVDLADQLDQLTKVTGRNKSTLTVAALSEYVAREAWQLQDIQDGIAEADRGEFASDEAVNAVFAKYGC